MTFTANTTDSNPEGFASIAATSTTAPTIVTTTLTLLSIQPVVRLKCGFILKVKWGQFYGWYIFYR